MSDLGKLWFSLGIKDETSKDYDNIKKKIEDKLKKELEIKVRPSIDINDIINKDHKRLDVLGKIQNALYRIDTLENRIKMNSKFTGGGSGYDEALRKIEQLRAAINSLNKADVGAVNRATGGGLTYQLNGIRLLVQEQDKLNAIQRKSDARRLAEQARLAAQEQKNLAKFTGEANNRLSSQSRIASEVKNQISGYLSIYAAERFLGSIIQIGGEFEKQKIALRSILGDASKAETIFSQIKTLAVESPFEFKDLASYAKQLSAFAIPYEELYDTTKRLADVSAGLGVDMGRIILAYGQVRSAAFLRGQEVRQFTEAGIPLIDELAKKFTQLEGNVVSAGEVFDRVSKRMVSFEMVKEVLWDLTNEGGKFYNMQEELSESLAGKWANLQDSYDIMLSEIAEGNNGPLKVSLEMLTSLMNNWRGLATVIGSLVVTYGTYKAAVTIVNTLDAIQIVRKQGLALATQRAAAAMVAETAAAAKMNAATAVTIGRINKLNGVLSSVGKGGWIGLALGAVVSLGFHLYSVSQEATRLKRELDEIGDKAGASVTVAVAGYKNLSDQLEKTNMGSKERLDIINQINNRYGEYLPNLFKEVDSNEQVAASIDKVTEAIKRKMQAQAYEQGLQKIEEEYADKLKEARKEIENEAKIFYGIDDKYLAKNFVRSLEVRIKPELAPGDVANITRDLAKAYDFSTKYLQKDAPVVIAVHKYLDLLKEQKQAEKDFAGNLDDRYKGLEMYENKLREVEERYNKTMPSDPDEARKHQVEMLTEQLKVLGNADDQYTKNYIANINARIAELSKESDEWVKIAERLSREELSVGGRKITTNFLFPKEEEKVNVIKFLERVGEEYEKVKKDIEGIEKLSPKLLTDKVKEDLEILRFQKKQYDYFGKSFGVDLTMYSKAGAKGLDKNYKKELKDAVQQAKDEMDVIARRWELYKDIFSMTGNKKYSMEIAFSNPKYFDEEATELTKLLNEKIKSRGLSIDIPFTETLENAKKLFGENNKDLLDIWDKIKKRAENSGENALKSEIRSMQDYLKEYGTFQQKKLAIERSYIAKIEEARARGNVNEVKLLERQRNSAIQKNEIEAIKQNIDWGSVFGDFGTMFKEQLQPTIDTLKTITRTSEFKSSSLQDQKVLYELISKLEQSNAIWDGDIFKKVSEDMVKYQSAMQGYIDAQEREKKATEVLALAKKKLAKAELSGGDVTNAKNELIYAQSEYDAATEAVNNFGNQVQQSTSDLQASSSRAVNMFNDLEAGLQGLASGNLEGIGRGIMQLDKLFNNSKLTESVGNALVKGFSKLFGDNSKVTQSLASTLGKGGFIAQIISAILSILDIFKDGIGPVISGLIDSILGAVNGIIKNILSGDIFVQIGKSIRDGIGSILNTITFGGFKSWISSSNAKEVAKTTERLTDSNDRLRNRVDSLKSEMSKTGGWKAINTAQQAKRDQETINKQTMDILKTQMGYHGSHHSNSYYWDLGLNNYMSINKTLANYARKYNKTASTVFSLEDLYKLTPEEMDYIRTYNVDVWKKMLDQGKYDKSEYWENYADLAGQLEEIENSLKETLTQVSFDSLRDSFIDSLMDMDKSAKDFASDFQEYLMRSILNAKISDLLDKDLQEFYDRWSEYAESGNKLEDWEINSLRSLWEDLTEKGLQIRDQTANIVGYNPSPSDSNSLGKAVQSLTEDTGNLLASYLNATRADVSIIKMNFEKFLNEVFPTVNLISQAQLQQLTLIADNTSRNVWFVEEIRDLINIVIDKGTRKIRI